MNGINEDGMAPLVPQWRAHFKDTTWITLLNRGEEASRLTLQQIHTFLQINPPSRKKPWPKTHGEFIILLDKRGLGDFFPCPTDQRGWEVLTMFSTRYAVVIYGVVKSGKGIERLLISHSQPLVITETRPWVIKPCPKSLLKEKLILFDCPGVEYYTKNKNQELSIETLKKLWFIADKANERMFARATFPCFTRLANHLPKVFFSWNFIPFTVCSRCTWVVNKKNNPNYWFPYNLASSEFCNVFRSDNSGDLRGLCENHHIVLFENVAPGTPPPLEFILNITGTRSFPHILVLSEHELTGVYPGPPPIITASFKEVSTDEFISLVKDKHAGLTERVEIIALRNFIKKHLVEQKQKTPFGITSEIWESEDKQMSDLIEIGSVIEEKLQVPSPGNPTSRDLIVKETAEKLIGLKKSSLQIPSFAELQGTGFVRGGFAKCISWEDKNATNYLLKQTSKQLFLLIKLVLRQKGKVKMSLDMIQKHVVNKSETLKRFSAEEVEIMLEYLTIKNTPRLEKHHITNYGCVFKLTNNNNNKKQ